MAAALALGGCATQGAVERAQLTADQAMTRAQASEVAAQRAQAAAADAANAAQLASAAAERTQSTAVSAASAAQAASAEAHGANDRLDHMAPTVQHLEHHHGHGTWSNVAHHRHHHHKS